MAKPILDPAVDMERLAFNKLITILSATTSFAPYHADAGQRYTLCQQAGVLGPLGSLAWNSPPAQVAGHVVDRLNSYGSGSLPGRPGFTALGALVDHLLKGKDVPTEDHKWLAGLIVHYGLVKDPAYLEQLQAQYGVAAPASPAAAAALGPGERVIVEKVWNSWDNFLDPEVLWGVHYTAQAVARVEVPQGNAMGTGFLIGPDLLLTNQHVLPSPAAAVAAAASFTYVLDVTGKTVASRVFGIREPDKFYYASPEPDLDYALVRLSAAPLGDVAIGGGADSEPYRVLVMTGRHRGYLRLDPRAILNLERVNIIQHPGGHELKAALTANRVEGEAGLKATRVKYRTDTEPGSSGSPVLSGIWDVLALHKGEVSPAAGSGYNVGVPLHAIVADLKQKAASDAELKAALAGFQPCFA